MSQAPGRWRKLLVRTTNHARRRRPVGRAEIELLEERCLLYAVNDPGDLPLDPKMGPAETANGTITLRSAIQQIDIDGTGSITFSGAMTINVGSQLNAITASGVTIDGGTLGSVVISGGAGMTGLAINGGGATIKNLVINGFGDDAIWLNSGGNTVQNDYIGTDASGSSAVANGVGILDTAGNNIIKNSVISGNALGGIGLSGCSNDLLTGDMIGTNVAGTAAVPNVDDGLLIENGATNNTIGGTTATTRDIVSGNTQCGIQIYGVETSGNLIEGDYIGIDASGSNPLPNGTPGLLTGGDGVLINNGATGNIVGGTGSGAGNVLSGNVYFGVQIANPGTSGNLVEGNWIGVNQTGTAALANTYGGVVIGNAVEDMGYASADTIGGSASGAGNLISGNGGPGISILGSENVVQGNLIGTALGGTKALGNNGAGVSLSGQATSNLIGGTSEGALNVISGNLQDGVDISDMGTSSNVVEGDFIGTNVDGASALPNGTAGTIAGSGVVISNQATGNLIGGSEAEAQNIISGNLGNGVVITGPGTSENVVIGNFIGTDVDGTTAVPNGTAGQVNNGAGVLIDLGATDNTIGGTDNSALNLISGNVSFGVQLSNQGTSGNLVEGNDIGTEVSGKNALPNGVDGVRIDTGASQNTVGGTATGAGNVIAFNTQNGVTVGANASDNSNNDTIEGNSIYANQLLGIDLGDDGVTANDSHGHTSGPNDWQDFPDLEAPSAGGAIVATLSGAAGTYRIEFFVNTSTVATVAAQGQTYLGFASLTIGASGTGSVSFTPSVSLASGASITATATASNGDTSEFSQNFALNWVTFGGDGFDAITDDTNNFETYSTEQWLSGPDGHEQPVFYAASSTLTVSASFQAPTMLSDSATVMAQGTGPDGITIPPTAVIVDGNMLILNPTAATTPFDDDAQFFQDFTITWQLSLDGGKTWNSAGTSDNPLYVSASDDPLPDPDSNDFYLTVVNSAVTSTLGLSLDGGGTVAAVASPANVTADASSSVAATIIARSWALFTGLNYTNFLGKPLTYYGTPAASDPTTQQLLANGYTPSLTVAQLLATGDGQCSAWAGLFLDTVAASGITGNYVVVTANAPHVGFMVNQWIAVGAGTSNDPAYPYVDSTVLNSIGALPYQVIKLAGYPGTGGQNSPDPESVFFDHIIVSFPSSYGAAAAYYDPSYGKTYTSAPDMQSQDISAFFKPVIAPVTSGSTTLANFVKIQLPSPSGNHLVFSAPQPWASSRTTGAGPSLPPDIASTPISTVDTLASTTTSTTFSVGITGADDFGGSGLASFALYVSTNGGPYVLDQSGITASASTGGLFTGSVSFTGVPGDTYTFYSVATDMAGNVEAALGGAQASITVAPAAPLVDVASALWTKIKTGRHKTAEALVVTFSGALDPADADDLAAYHLFTLVKGKKPGTRKEKTVGLASATYNTTAHTVTLLPRGTVPKPPLQLALNPTLLLDAEGRPISGDVTLTLGKTGANLTSTAALRPAAEVSATAVDALLLSDWRPSP